MRTYTMMAVLALVLPAGGAAAAEQSGLGGYKATVTPDNRLKYTLESAEFTFTRLTAADTGATEVTIAGSNEVSTGYGSSIKSSDSAGSPRSMSNADSSG